MLMLTLAFYTQPVYWDLITATLNLRDANTKGLEWGLVAALVSLKGD